MSEQATMTDSGQTSELADRLLRLMPRLQQWAASTVQANRSEQDLSLRQLAVLYLIREGAIFPSSLARRLRISPAVVTGLLDRLEQRGYVRRRMDPGDRRRQQLVLTESGHAASLAVQQLLTQELAEQFAEVPAVDLAAIHQALDVLEKTVTALERRSPKLGPVPAENDEVWETETAATVALGNIASEIDPFDGDEKTRETAAAAG